MRKCLICGEDNEKLLEEHHLYGKSFSEEKIPLCLNCHKTVSLIQNGLPINFRSKKNQLSRLLFAQVSISALMKRAGEMGIKNGKKLMELTVNETGNKNLCEISKRKTIKRKSK